MGGKSRATGSLRADRPPAFQAEYSDKLNISTKRFCRSPSQLPARAPGPRSKPAQLPRRLQEGRLPVRRDGVVDSDQDGPGLGLGVEGQPPRRSSRWPGWRPRLAGLGPAPEQTSDHSDQHDIGRDEDRRLQAESVCSEAPEQCLQRRAPMNLTV
jgi:hypothetical protein